MQKLTIMLTVLLQNAPFSLKKSGTFSFNVCGAYTTTLLKELSMNASMHESHPLNQPLFIPQSSGFHSHTLHENKNSPYQPVALIISHIHNRREIEAALDLTHRLLVELTSNAPTIRLLSPQMSIALLHGKLIDQLANDAYGAIVTFNDWATHAIADAYKTRQYKSSFMFTNMHDTSSLDALDENHPARNHLSGISVKHPS
ncbi:MAG: hypothetical protein PVJ92_03125, partial [Candidatus Dependentiae bacterium]